MTRINPLPSSLRHPRHLRGPLGPRNPRAWVAVVIWVGVAALVASFGYAPAAVAQTTSRTSAGSAAAPQSTCNPTCTALCAVHEVDASGAFTCQPTQACISCITGQPTLPPMCVPPIDPADPYYDACFDDDPGDPPPGPPVERALLVTNTSGPIDSFIPQLESVYYNLMSFHDSQHWGQLIGMHSIEGGTLSGVTHEFVLKTAAYRSRCHDEFTARIDVDIQPGVSIQIMADGLETHYFTGPYTVTDLDITWQGLPNATIKVVYDTTGLNPGGPPTFDNGFNFKEFYVASSSSSGSCSPVIRLNGRTLRSALAGAGVSSDQSHDINTVVGAELFYVEADGPLQHQGPPIAGRRTPPGQPMTNPSADPWMSDHTTSLRNLMDCDPAGATCSDPTHGGSPKAFSRHGGGDPGVVIVQIDTNLNSEAMLAAGDYRLPELWFHNGGVSNGDPAGGSTTDCQSYGGGICVPHPDPSHDNHGTGVSAWFSTLVNGNGFSSLTPNSTYWFAGTGLDFNELSIATYEVAVSDVIARLGEMDPAKIDVVSLSFGTSVPSIAMAAAIGDYTDAGVLFVAAAGNEDHDSPIFPASASNVIGVGSTGTYDLALLGTQTFSNVDSLSVFYFPFPGSWGSNKGGDVVMAGTGPKPLIAEYRCAISALECITDQDCFSVAHPGDTCSNQLNLYREWVGMGTSHSTPQIAALLANTLADVLFIHPLDYPALHDAMMLLPESDRKRYVANVLKAALYQSAERWFPTVELPHEDFGYGRGDHMAIMQFMLESEQANSTPGEYAVNSTDIGRSLFTRDTSDTTWEDLEPDRMGMLGQGSANPTRTTFRAERGLKDGTCWNLLNPIRLLGAVLGEPLKVVVQDPSIIHDTAEYNHQKTELLDPDTPQSPDNVLVEFAFQQRIEVKIDTTRWGLMECLWPLVFQPVHQSFFSIIEQVDLSPDNRKTWTMEYSLDGFGYNYDMSDLTVKNQPLLTPFEVTPKCCSFLHAMSDAIEDNLEDLDQFLRTYMLPSVEVEAMNMVETALDVHLAFNRTTPQQYWTTRFANAHPSWHTPQFQHWLASGPPLGAEHRNLDLAPFNHLSSVQKVPILRPVLDPGEDPHLYLAYPPEIDILDPLMEPVSESERWDDISYQSVNTIREQLNQADLNRADEPGGFNEFLTTPNQKISDLKFRLTNLKQRNVRSSTLFYDSPTPEGHYGRIVSHHEAELWTCANDPVDRPPELAVPAPAFDCALAYQGVFRFDLTVYLHRNDWYAAYPLSEIAQAGHYHHFENRLTVDPKATTVEVTLSPPGLPWWDVGPNPCDDISDPYSIGRGCDITKQETEAAILGIYAPTITRLVDSMSFDRFGVNANLGTDYLTLRRQLDFLQSYLQDMYAFKFDGYDYNVGTMDGALSAPNYQRISQAGRSSVIVHKIQLDRAPPGERLNNDPTEDLVQPASPTTGATLSTLALEIKYGRCVNDNTIACDDDAQCGGAPDSCVSLRYCGSNGAPPSQFPLDTCTEANISADCGSGSQWECNRVPTRIRYADHAVVGVDASADQSSASINESYFTPYQDSATVVVVDTDLWLAMSNAPDSVFAVGLKTGSSLRKPDANPLDQNFVVDGFSRWEKSLVRSDTCLWRANMLFTYDRWANCPAGGTDCSQTHTSQHTRYSLTPTRDNWDDNPLDPSCSGAGGVGQHGYGGVID